jgi:hypothetical protein
MKRSTQMHYAYIFCETSTWLKSAHHQQIMTFNLSAESDKIWMKRQRNIRNILRNVSFVLQNFVSVAVVIHVDGLRQCL